MNKTQKIWFVAIGIIALVTVSLFQNCGEVVFVTDDTGNVVLGNPNPPPVCDPLNAAASGCPPSGPNPPGGLVGNLYYQNKGAGDAGWEQVDKYINLGIKTGYEIRLSSLFVPTRKFDTGFQAADGTYVFKKPEHGGAKLVEWFAFDAEGVMKLAPGDAAGLYEFAIISDDGAIVMTKDNANAPWSNFIDNDGLTSTRMECSDRIQLDQNSRVPLRIKYFQGPKNEIAVNFIYRKKQSSSSYDSLCGTADVNFYGVVESASSLGRSHAQLCSQFPNSKYGKLCTRGWKPLTSANFE